MISNFVDYFANSSMEEKKNRKHSAENRLEIDRRGNDIINLSWLGRHSGSPTVNTMSYCCSSFGEMGRYSQNMLEEEEERRNTVHPVYMCMKTIHISMDSPILATPASRIRKLNSVLSQNSFHRTCLPDK